MAKHRISQPVRGAKTARGVVAAGALTIGAITIPAAASAHAAPINIPGIGVIEIPGLPGIPAVPVPGVAPAPAPAFALPPAPASTGHQAAVDAAMSKIGAPYSYGAAGPSAFDCSGLIYWAFQQAGISVPRDSYGQAAGGQQVSFDSLQPGDVITYNGGSHAALYVGNGQVVHASNEETPVETMTWDAWDLYTATRF